VDQATIGRTLFIKGEISGSEALYISFRWRHSGSHSLSNDVTKIRASDETVVGTFSIGADAESVIFDGANLWMSITPNNLRLF
jgi:hypothetical protein